jgi:lysophospholipase L1-like esterase
MRRTITTITALALFMAMWVPAALGAQEETVYLSLGTSLAAGSQADEGGNTTFSSDRSYTDELYQRVKGRIGTELRHVKLGCAGETTDQFVGGVNAAGRPSNCAGLYATGSQLGDALATIAGGNVILVTIDIGANDLFEAQALCGGDPTCLGNAIGQIAQNTAQIVGAIRAAGYEGPMFGMSYYNPLAAAAIGFFPGVVGQHAPDPQLAGLSDALVRGHNGALTQVFAAFGVGVVDVYSAFNAGDFGDDRPANGVPDNLDVLCALSYMCPDDPAAKANIHLNKRGYTVIAKEFLELATAAA